MISCRFIEGLYGFRSPAVPVLGDYPALIELEEAAIVNGFSITEATSSDNTSEGDFATKLIQQHLQRSGVLPVDVALLDRMSDDQLMQLSFEPRALDEIPDRQLFGVPPFKTINIAAKLAHLRRLAHFNMMLDRGKPIFQLGILTMNTFGGSEAQYFAQLFPAEVGMVTNTVWLYRWCISGLDGEYEEHWRAFDGPFNVGLASPMQSEPPTDPISHLPPARDQLPIAEIQPVSRKRDRESEEADQQQPCGAVLPRSVEPTDVPAALSVRKPRRKRYSDFDHSSLTDDQLFSIEPYLIQGEVIIRLAKIYSNGDIFTRINAYNPGGVKAVNVITKRLTHAIENVAQLQGRTVENVRQEILDAKEANGVVHKMKMDVATYSEGQRKYTRGE